PDIAVRQGRWIDARQSLDGVVGSGFMLAEDARHLEVVRDQPNDVWQHAYEFRHRHLRRNFIVWMNLLRMSEGAQRIREWHTHTVGHMVELRQVEIRPPVKGLDDGAELRLGRHQPPEEPSLAEIQEIDEAVECLR